jgi:hypothetical protein
MNGWCLLLLVLLAEPLGRMPRVPPRTPPTPPYTANLALSIRTAAGEVKAQSAAGQAPPQQRANVTVKAGEKPQIRWQVKNLDPKRAIRSVVVHFLVHKQTQPGEAVPAGPRKGSWMDSVMGTDISAKQAVSGSTATAIWDPGCYLVEIELLDDQAKRRNYCLLEMTVTP